MIRKLILAFFIVSLSANARAQDSAATARPKTHRFSAGTDYIYTGCNLEYTRYSSRFFWNDKDSTNQAFTQAQLDSLNQVQNVRSSVHNIRVRLVIHVVQTPRLVIDAGFSLGISRFNFKLSSTSNDTLKLTLSSTLGCPSWGIDLNGEYFLNPHWGIALQPSLYYSAGTTGVIQDIEMLQLPGFIESRQNTVNYLYTRINLAAIYRIKGFRIIAGPAFSYCYFANDYVVAGTNPNTGDSFRRDIKAQFRAETFFDGFAGIEWNIIPLLAINCYGGFGRNLYVQPGVKFNF
jgi:hypothetical protein